MVEIVLAHGGDMGESAGNLSGLVGIGPVILGVVLIGYFLLLLGGDRGSHRSRPPEDDVPSPARQMFDGAYPWTATMLAADIDAHFNSLNEDTKEAVRPTSST